jgi:hypothetical protein
MGMHLGPDCGGCSPLVPPHEHAGGISWICAMHIVGLSIQMSIVRVVRFKRLSGNELFYSKASICLPQDIVWVGEAC